MEKFGKIIFFVLVIGLLLVNTFLLMSRPNEVVVYKNKEVHSTKNNVFLQCLESRKPYSDLYETKTKVSPQNNDIEDCKKAAMELSE